MFICCEKKPFFFEAFFFFKGVGVTCYTGWGAREVLIVLKVIFQKQVNPLLGTALCLQRFSDIFFHRFQNCIKLQEIKPGFNKFWKFLPVLVKFISTMQIFNTIDEVFLNFFQNSWNPFEPKTNYRFIWVFLMTRLSS